ncbi:MAG TPA: TPM domain-containing protein [Spirochaetota bacterium]|nr:TPM domain-containing protein [Spirochaetota bacterium]
MDRISSFISQEGKNSIIAAVQAAEKRTSGEIVPMIVSDSSRYPAATFLTAMALSICAGVIAAFFITRHEGSFAMLESLRLGRMSSLVAFLAVFLPSLPLFSALIAAFPVIKKLFLPRSEMTEQVSETAFASFYRHQLDETAERNGILLFISIFERQVKIIADRGINEKVDPGKWDEIAVKLAEGIRRGAPADAVMEAVRQCGEVLARHFPGKKGDRDELRNIIVE